MYVGMGQNVKTNTIYLWVSGDDCVIVLYVYEHLYLPDVIINGRTVVVGFV